LHQTQPDAFLVNSTGWQRPDVRRLAFYTAVLRYHHGLRQRDTRGDTLLDAWDRPVQGTAVVCHPYLFVTHLVTLERKLVRCRTKRSLASASVAQTMGPQAPRRWNRIPRELSVLPCLMSAARSVTHSSGPNHPDVRKVHCSHPRAARIPRAHDVLDRTLSPAYSSKER